ncbi:MAG: glycosyl hydrolase-related protein [Candidatus Sumerlaeota bacterium]|nr:glycosyl hydrolase-related protein [Candidatus Sumerlaeota bacterium]
MAKGHIAVVRRSLNPPEWIRVRLKEMARWQVQASAPIEGWHIREAKFLESGEYKPIEPWKAIHEGDIWGAPDGTFFLRATIRVPHSFRGLPVEFELRTPTEMMIRVDGRLINAIDPNRSRVPLLKRARGGETMRMEIEAYMRSAPDDNRIKDIGHGCTQIWRNPRLVAYDRAVEDFFNDIQVPFDVAQGKLVESDVCAYLYHHLDETLKLVDRETPDRAAFMHSLGCARKYLRKNIYKAEGMTAPGRLALVGHAHVDIAYHWRLHHGIRKNARTSIVQLALMDEYPEFRYCHTQPFVYEMMKERYPEIFRRIKQKVRNGQWELVGGLYVEPDCNTPSGESLIRQCLYGKRFFMKEFGVDVDTCWLPDVFGNSWIMPQILMRAGIRYFVSNKMSTWNDTNTFPHTNFLWKGVDGTLVAACVPATHFISWLEPDQLLGNWEGFKEKVTVGESMNMYGFGDGGGGATREMLETARRIRNFPGLPRTRMVTGKQYLDEAFAEKTKLEVWDSELYLEMHRGVTTTKGLLKKLNRRCEFEAREAEIWSVFAQRFGLRAPKEELERAWKTVLVNQFHDILPGSHTTPVGREAEASYHEALRVFQSIKAHALDVIARNVSTKPSDGAAWLVFNSLGWPRGGIVKIPVPSSRPKVPSSRPKVPSSKRRVPSSEFRVHSYLSGEKAEEGVAGADIISQEIVERDGSRALLCYVPEVPSVGYRTIYISKNSQVNEQRSAKESLGTRGENRQSSIVNRKSISASLRLLENRFFRIRFDKNGEIASLLDKRYRREVIAKGQRGAALQLFEDKPGIYDAWDIVRQYKDKQWDISASTSVRVAENGPVRAGIVIEKEFFESRLLQHIWIYSDIARIDFETYVDWRERHKLLKVAFPVSILARQATYDLSYGSIQRPTHGNTSWDKAKFEVCGHLWADLSEAGYGVSLLNDCKYGHDIQGNCMRLSLLRGTERPDPDSDLGEHEFTYSLFPHAGAWQDAHTEREALALNNPLAAVAAKREGGRGARLEDSHSFLSIEAKGAHLGTLKPAEDGRDIIARVVEMRGGRETVAIRFDQPLKQALETDLLERPEKPVSGKAQKLKFAIQPFEIKSFKLEL